MAGRTMWLARLALLALVVIAVGGCVLGYWLAAVIPLATTAVGVAAWTPQQRRQVLGR